METLTILGIIGAGYYAWQWIQERGALAREREALRQLRAMRAGTDYGYSGPIYR